MPTNLFGNLEVTHVSDKPLNMSVLIYGQPGIGKTLFAATAHDVKEMRDVLMVDIEGGSLTLRKDYGDVEVVRPKSIKELAKIGKALYTKEHGYNTVIIDSLTETQKLSMREIMEDVVAAHPDRNIETPSMREWGINGEQTRKIVRDFRDLPMNVIFTAHAQDKEKPGSDGDYQTKVSLTGKLAEEIPGMLDSVFYLDVRKVKTRGEDKKLKTTTKRVLLTENKGDIIAKDRTQLLPSEIDDPTMSKVYDLIYKGDN